jgi:hypothetical protein
LLDRGASDLGNRRQERPLIGKRKSLLVEKNAVAQVSWAFLQRQGDQIAETTLRQSILIGKETVIRIQPDVRPEFHRFGQDIGPEPASQRGGHGLLKEQPDVASVAGTRTLQKCRYVQAAACLQDGCGVSLPIGLVEIGGQEKAAFILQHRIHADDEIAAGRILSRQVPADDVVRDRQEVTVLAIGTLDAWLVAEANSPLVDARRLVTGLAALAALEAPRIDVLTSTKQGTKQSDLGFRRGLTMDKAVVRVHEEFLDRTTSIQAIRAPTPFRRLWIGREAQASPSPSFSKPNQRISFRSPGRCGIRKANTSERQPQVAIVAVRVICRGILTYILKQRHTSRRPPRYDAGSGTRRVSATAIAERSWEPGGDRL